MGRVPSTLIPGPTANRLKIAVLTLALLHWRVSGSLCHRFSGAGYVTCYSRSRHGPNHFVRNGGLCRVPCPDPGVYKSNCKLASCPAQPPNMSTSYSSTRNSYGSTQTRSSPFPTTARGISPVSECAASARKRRRQEAFYVILGSQGPDPGIPVSYCDQCVLFRRRSRGESENSEPRCPGVRQNESRFLPSLTLLDITPN